MNEWAHLHVCVVHLGVLLDLRDSRLQAVDLLHERMGMLADALRDRGRVHALCGNLKGARDNIDPTGEAIDLISQPCPLVDRLDHRDHDVDLASWQRRGRCRRACR